MKAKENTLYYTGEYLNGKLINDLDITQEVREVVLTDEISKKLRDILGGNVSQASHRCISVYRDGFVLNGHTYNICLSCGDFYRDDDHYYLTKEGIEEFKNIKEGLISAKNDRKENQ